MLQSFPHLSRYVAGPSTAAITRLTSFPQASLARRERVFPHMVATPVAPDPTPPNDVEHVAAHQIEFTTLMGIQDAARDCSVDGSHEPGWNGKVHQPLLSCALEPIKKRFKSVNV
jgi:hypothetical protein